MTEQKRVIVLRLTRPQAVGLLTFALAGQEDVNVMPEHQQRDVFPKQQQRSAADRAISKLKVALR